ncbi:MAG: GH92 family glycosyl hydrolase [Rikenellaceae bacterium]
MKKLNFTLLGILLVVVVSVVVMQVAKRVSSSQRDYVSLVYPHLDSENSRWFYFSSACRPFGMVNLSPDTEIDGTWGSGYRYNVDTVKGFSHVHAWQLSALSVMPVMVDGDDEKGAVYGDFFSKFSHETEFVQPGYHKLHLDRYDIDVELTSTMRVGFHKYGFTQDGTPAVLLNLNTPLGPSNNADGVLTQVGDRAISGEVTSVETLRRPRPVRVYFELAFDKDIVSVERDEKTGNYLVLFADGAKDVLMKAAISYTSAENAKLNMSSELAGWDFKAIVKDSHDEWNEMLSRVDVQGADEPTTRRFYTDLWHALQGRRVLSDVNGNYPDNTGETFRIGEIPLGDDGKPLFKHYNSDSFWGAQWTIQTLWQLVYPEVADEFVNSMLMYYRDGGMIPRGPSGGNYTYVMTGASSTPFIVAAYQKGIRNYDVELVYEGMRKNHMLENGMMERAGYEHNSRTGGGLKYYIEKGYIPYPLPEYKGEVGGMPFHRQGPAQTLENAYQDWTLAQMALALGKEDDYKMFMERSMNYKNVIDSESGWARPRDVKGVWYGGDSFDPYDYAIGFVESSAAQMTWYVPQDLVGLAELQGGIEASVEKLNTSFETASHFGFTSGSRHDQETDEQFKRTPINYGNQPSIQTAFVFNHLGRPDLTQYWSREVVKAAFSGFSTSAGYRGDEDQGLMGSLAVLYKIGLFQVTGGADVEPYYELGSPIFDRVEIKLNPDYYSGDKIVIDIKDNNDASPYIKSAVFNGKEVDSYKILHKDMVQGGVLELQMGGK